MLVHWSVEPVTVSIYNIFTIVICLGAAYWEQLAGVFHPGIELGSRTRALVHQTILPALNQLSDERQLVHTWLGPWDEEIILDYPQQLGVVKMLFRGGSLPAESDRTAKRRETRCQTRNKWFSSSDSAEGNLSDFWTPAWEQDAVSVLGDDTVTWEFKLK